MNCQDFEDLQNVRSRKSSASIRTNFWACLYIDNFPYFKAVNPIKILPITPLIPLGISEVPKQISSQESTSNRVADIQHPLDWMLFEVNSSIHLNVQLSILQNWTSGNLFEGNELLLSICRNPLQVYR